MGKKILMLAGEYAEDYETMVGAQILAAAGVIRGKWISAYPACAAEVKLAGAEYAQIKVDEAVTDGNFVTAPA
jgi:protease I